MISMTSPSLSPSSFISVSDSRAKPRPLSAGARLATCTFSAEVRSSVSVSAIYTPTSCRFRNDHCPLGFNWGLGRSYSIFDGAGDLSDQRPREKAGGRCAHLVEEARHHDRVVLVEAIEPGSHHARRVGRVTVERAFVAKAGNGSEFGPGRPRAQ